MSRRSIAPLLRESLRLGLSDEPWEAPTLKRLQVGANSSGGEGPARRAAEVTAHRRSPRRVPFNRGEVQLVARGTDLTLDITAKHYDVAGCARREHAWGRLTRLETQHLITALVAVLSELPDLANAQ